jgi:hypothetical protein
MLPNERGSSPRLNALFTGGQLRECDSSPRVKALFTVGCAVQPWDCGSSRGLDALFTG